MIIDWSSDTSQPFHQSTAQSMNSFIFGRRILTRVCAGSPSMLQPYPVKCLSARDVVILVKRHRED